MGLSETQLKEKVIKFVKKEYPTAWVYKTSDRWTAGIPDILICKEGVLYAIELKVGKNKATKIQEYVLKQIKESGGFSTVSRSVGDVKNFLEGR